MARSVARSISSSRLGCSRACRIAVTARAAAPKLGKLAATVVGGAAGRGRSRRVADVITPSVPSEPTNRLVRS